MQKGTVGRTASALSKQIEYIGSDSEEENDSDNECSESAEQKGKGKKGKAKKGQAKDKDRKKKKKKHKEKGKAPLLEKLLQSGTYPFLLDWPLRVLIVCAGIEDPAKASMLTQLALTSMSMAQTKAMGQTLRGTLPRPLPASGDPFSSADSEPAAAPAGLLLPPKIAPVPAHAALPSLPSPAGAPNPASALLLWLRHQEAEGQLTADASSWLEHIAANSADPLHGELLLHWQTFGSNDNEMKKSVNRMIAVRAK